MGAQPRGEVAAVRCPSRGAPSPRSGTRSRGQTSPCSCCCRSGSGGRAMAECSGAPGQDGLGARDGFHACRGSPLAQAAAGAAPRFGVRDTASGPPASQPGPGRRQRRGGAGGSRGGERAGPGAEPAGPPPAAAALTPTTAGAAAGSGPSPRRRRGRGVLHPPPCPPLPPLPPPPPPPRRDSQPPLPRGSAVLTGPRHSPEVNRKPAVGCGGCLCVCWGEEEGANFGR